MYNLDYFINKFEAIPEEKWCEEDLTQAGGVHCALGHCGGWTTESKESNALSNILREFYILQNMILPTVEDEPKMSRDAIVYAINDGQYGTGTTPKQRILNALYKIRAIKMKHVDITKEIANIPIQEEVPDKLEVLV